VSLDKSIYKKLSDEELILEFQKVMIGQAIMMSIGMSFAQNRIKPE